VVEFGEIDDPCLRYGLSATLSRLNRITNGERLFAGEELVVVEPEAGSPDNQLGAPRVEKGTLELLAADEPLLLAAARTGANPWAVAQLNGLSSFADQFAGLTLVASGGERPLRAWPAPLQQVAFRSLPLIQGLTAEITADAPSDVVIDAQLGSSLVTFASHEGHWVALQGVHAMQEPGLYLFSLTLRLADGTTREFAQDVRVASGDYPNDPPLAVSPEYIDPQVNQAELDTMRAMVSAFTAERAWTTLFSLPVDTGITSSFGRRRLFNGTYATFHGGIDFAGRVGREIYAPAAGRVVFAGAQDVCGMATVIDHGWGVYSRFCHQESLSVSTGEVVAAGARIGAIGRSGRVTGPHLHWEIWVGGVQVDPQEWLEESFP
jgi:murein DD-endopeptidase MepM/ murein hydrolase activator NlpD